MDETQNRAEVLAARLVERCIASGATVSTAESCTAGLIASCIAGVPGASAVLRGGAVTYCDEVKRDVLGVDSETLAAHTAVSPQCAGKMAERSRAMFASDMAVSATGFAGPGGGTLRDPAGTVYIACAGARRTRVERCEFEGDRNSVRLQAACAALQILLDELTAYGDC